MHQYYTLNTVHSITEMSLKGITKIKLKVWNNVVLCGRHPLFRHPLFRQSHCATQSGQAQKVMGMGKFRPPGAPKRISMSSYGNTTGGTCSEKLPKIHFIRYRVKFEPVFRK